MFNNKISLPGHDKIYEGFDFIHRKSSLSMYRAVNNMNILQQAGKESILTRR